MHKDLILVKQLTITLGAKKVLDNISLFIDQGDMVAVIGANGSGKTSLLKALCGLVKPVSGVIQIAGMKYWPPSQIGSIHKLIGYATDTPSLYPRDTTSTYLQFIAKLRQLNKKESERQIQHYLELLNLSQYQLELIHTLSKGTQQRINLAQAMLHSPQILILDEPTNALDQQETKNFCHHLRQLQNSGVTIIIASHQYNEVIPLCSYMLKVQNGNVSKILTPLTKTETNINHEQHSEQWHYST